jgi:hypothetical protein
MSGPTAADMARYCVEQLADDGSVLGQAIFGLHRSLHLHGESAGDLSRSVKEVLAALESYMATVDDLVEYTREALGEENGGSK